MVSTFNEELTVLPADPGLLRCVTKLLAHATARRMPRGFHDGVKMGPINTTELAQVSVTPCRQIAKERALLHYDMRLLLLHFTTNTYCPNTIITIVGNSSSTNRLMV